MPAFNLSDADGQAIAEYIHSVLARVGPKARPPGVKEISDRDVLVGDVPAGKTQFDTKCATCHSVEGDLKSIGAKYKDPRTLQNAWVAGGTATGRDMGAAVGTSGQRPTATVTTTDGQKFEGALIRKDDFVVSILLPDGNRRSFALDTPGNVPQVQVRDPLNSHREIARTLDEKTMHDVTAYLATVK